LEISGKNKIVIRKIVVNDNVLKALVFIEHLPMAQYLYYYGGITYKKAIYKMLLAKLLPEKAF